VKPTPNACSASALARRPIQLHGKRAVLSQGHSHGQALVEFALVAPLFFMLIFGIIEFSLINASIGAFNFAAKDAARLGSLLGRSAANADSQMIADIQSHVLGLVPATIVEIEIFQSDEEGDINTSVEDAYDGNGNAIGAQTWPPYLRNDNLIDADYLGVRITYQYTYLTAFLAGSNSSLQLTALSIQRIEPADFQGDIKGTQPLALRFGNTSSQPADPKPVTLLATTPPDVWKGGSA
jgi:hypothetical protein